MNAQRKRPLKLGLVLPEAEWDMGGKTAGWSDYVAMARLIEDMGIDSIWFVDHLLYRGDATTIEQQGVSSSMRHAVTRVGIRRSWNAPSPSRWTRPEQARCR